MKAKSHLRTVRFSPEEGVLVDEYIKKNPLFESFSSLARVATLAFIGQSGTIHLNAIARPSVKRPRFLWDYDITEESVREILRSPGLSAQKKWLIERLLSQARFEEVTSYLDIREIGKVLPLLKLPAKIKDRWEYAIKRWSQNG